MGNSKPRRGGGSLSKLFHGASALVVDPIEFRFQICHPCFEDECFGSVGPRQVSTLPVSGTLSADIAASGTQLFRPRDMERSTCRRDAFRASQCGLRTCSFEGTGKQINANLKVDVPAGTANGNVGYEPATGLYTAELHAPGLKLDQLENREGAKTWGCKASWS